MCAAEQSPSINRLHPGIVLDKIDCTALQDILSKVDGHFPSKQRVYSEEIADGVTFDVTITREVNSDKHVRTDFAFKVLSKNGSEKSILGNLVFSTTDQNPYYHLRHREVATGTLEISGSDVLKKAEAFIQTLIETNILPERPFVINAGQLAVIDWGLKNGYVFRIKDRQELYEAIAAGHPGYVTDVTITDEGGWQRHGYIFKKELAEWARTTPCGAGGSEADTTLQAERFSLMKEPKHG